MIRRVEIPVAPFDLGATFHMQLIGKFDPTGSRRGRALRKVHLDARGNVVVWRFTQLDSGLRIEVDGDDGSLLESFVGQFPLRDGAEEFEPEHPLLSRLARRLRGLRILRVPWVFDVAAGSILQQRVRWQEGYRDFRKVALKFGVRVPGGAAFPSSARLAEIPVARIEALGIDPKRAFALHRLAVADARRVFLRMDADSTQAVRRLLSIRGIGQWTAGRVAGLGYGDPDAVIVGDLHMPSMVTAALAGEPEGTDERMLELLAPYAGQRFRVLRQLLWAGHRLMSVPERVAMSATAIGT